MVKQLRAAQMEECIACGSCMLACARTRQKSLSLDKSAIRIRTAGGFRSAMIADVCLACAEPACAAVCSAGALARAEGRRGRSQARPLHRLRALRRGHAASEESTSTRTSATQSSAPTAACACRSAHTAASSSRRSSQTSPSPRSAREEVTT